MPTRRSPVWPATPWAACVFVVVALLPVTSLAQTRGVSAPSEADGPRSRQPSRVYVAMWTTHLKHEVIALDNNWAVGVTHRGYFGATFLNSFGRRAFAGGLQRTLFSTAPRILRTSAGFRLGAVTGYDGRLMKMARDTPVLPLIQPFAVVDVGRIGFEVSYTFVVVSVAVSYRF